MQIAKLARAKEGRYIKFVAKSEVNGRAWTSIAELGIQIESTPTSIDALSAGMAFPNGNSSYYDLSGREVVNPSHGIYINNGKKIILPM